LDFPVRNILLLDEWEIDILSHIEQAAWSPADDSRLGVRARILLEGVRGALALGRTIKSLFGGAKFKTSKYEPLDDLAGEEVKWCRLLGLDTTRFEESEIVELLLNAAGYVGMPIGRDFPPPGSDFSMTADFRLDIVPDDLALVYEGLNGGPRSIRINEVDVEERGEPTFVWDSSNMALPIASRVKVGENRLRMEWTQPDYPSLFPSTHGIEPVCLAGTFWVKRGRIVEQKFGAPSLPWSQIGLPNYIGAITYKSSFEVPLRYMSQRLFLKFEDIGETAEVRINGTRAGVVLWRPYSLDITPLVDQGENTIEVTVANTAANLLGKPAASGIIGEPYIAPYWRHRVRLGG